ncbi:hypothetical protein LX83_005290 [Goodfellowiella coeruleoviolacea]|uniref:Uncharacterized protein n=1 Tax=Goodfellowiella coeruleoviolacea TaxID=334858 RepID=A0AAE3KIW3_9PSEU|nr:hypothetical protein [Goodfellowiella coeruleoviolacea]
MGGYRVAPRVARPDWADAGLPPGELVSMSNCVVDLVPAGPEDWQFWFADPESAEQARARSGVPGAQVLVVGFSARDIPALVEDMAEAGWDELAGGVPERLARHQPVTDGRVGQVLGFELVGFDFGGWHTWICLGGLVSDVERATGVRPGRWGLIQDGDEARRAAAWLTESGNASPDVYFWSAALLASVAHTGAGGAAARKSTPDSTGPGD